MGAHSFRRPRFWFPTLYIQGMHPMLCTNQDTIGPEESVLIREMSLFQRLKHTIVVLGEEESVLFREVSIFRGVGVPLYSI